MPKDERSGIEVMAPLKRYSAFDAESHGYKLDKTKDYRFVSEKLIDHRKGATGFQVAKLEKKGSSEKHEYKAKGMILMERPLELAEQSRKYKEQLTRSRSQAVRSRVDEEAERLSSKYGQNLHKHFYDEGSN